DLARASAGQSVTLTLTNDLDASRGDVIAEAGRPPAVTDRLSCRIVWMGEDALTPGRTYLLKLGTCTATATFEPGMRIAALDARTLITADRMAAYAIGHCTLKLDRPIAVDRYADSRDTGGFIVIDRESYDTIGMGFVEDAGQGQGRWPWLRT